MHTHHDGAASLHFLSRGVLMPPEPQKSLAEVLAGRGDSMAGAESDWARHLLDVPDDSRRPLAMSGPHPLAVEQQKKAA